MDYYLGEIRIFAGNYAPQNWLLCQGQSLNIAEYQALYSLLGTLYGGNGVSTFNLPDLRGRIPVGQGTGPGLTARTLGQTGGSETVTLTSANLPAHSHAFNTLAAPATTGVLAAGNGNQAFAQGASGAMTYLKNTAPSPTATTLDAASYGSSGGGQAHNNMMPSMGLSFIIAVDGGLYPQRA